MSFTYVYVLRSVNHPDRHYTGLTTDLKARLAKHNLREVSHTSKFAPWTLETAVAFSSRDKASAFEHYLKSGSGRAFAHRHF
jgi:putative endonuclease